MLTIDDAKTIMAKYGESGFFYELDFNKIPSISSGKTYHYDWFTISFTTFGSYLRAEVVSSTSLYVYLYYFKKSDGTMIHPNNSGRDTDKIVFMPEDNDLIIGYYITSKEIPNHNPYTSGSIPYSLILPVSPLQIPVVNGEFDNKFYIDVIGEDIVGYLINGTAVTLQTDEKGTYLELPSATESVIGTTDGNFTYPLYRVVFREFKSLPVLKVDTVYCGTPQKLKLSTSEGDYITKFQAYYQGKPLKDNIINLPVSSNRMEYYADIVIDLKDNEYPFCRVKLKAKATLYECRSQAQIETAIENGIKTIRIERATGTTSCTVTGVEFNSMSIYANHVTLEDCTLNNVTFINSTSDIIDNGGNTFNNCDISGSGKFTMINQGSQFNNCNISSNNRLNFIDYDLYITNGSITNCKFRQSLIISDGNVTITGCEFINKHVKDYFPSFLYLTGEYDVKNNSFELHDEWEEPAFNMCIIKTTEDFKPSQFISNNSFDFDIICGEEDPNTFYYNIVDDDKIKAVRLS